MYLKLAEKPLFTIFIAGIPPGRFTEVTQIITSDAHCMINVNTLETKFEMNKVPKLYNKVTKMSKRLIFVSKLLFKVVAVIFLHKHSSERMVCNKKRLDDLEVPWNMLCSLIGQFQLVSIVKISHLIGKIMTGFDSVSLLS